MNISLNIHSSIKEIFDYYKLEEIDLKFKLEEHIQKGADNIIPIVTNNGIIRAKWGLVPHFIKGIDNAKKKKIYTVNSKKILSDYRVRGSIRSRRCIIPINFYEVNHYRIDVFFKPLFSLAGIYDIWEENNKRYIGFALIITPSNKLLKETDKFMPVYLKKTEEKIWLRDHRLRIIKDLTLSYNNEMWINTRDNEELIK